MCNVENCDIRMYVSNLDMAFVYFVNKQQYILQF